MNEPDTPRSFEASEYIFAHDEDPEPRMVVPLEFACEIERESSKWMALAEERGRLIENLLKHRDTDNPVLRWSLEEDLKDSISGES